MYNTLFTVHIIYISVCSHTQQLTQVHTNPERGGLQQHLTQAHIHTQTLSVEASSNSSLRHIYTHTNPECGGLQQQLTQAHIYTQTQVWRPPATAHSGTYIHTNPERGGLQQQLTQAHIYTQTLSVEASSNSSLRHTQKKCIIIQTHTNNPERGGSNSSFRYTQTHKQIHIHNYTDIYKQP